MGWADWTRGDEIGRGAMGRVYRGASVATGAPVAFKTVMVPDPRHFARVAREAAAMARLDHPHVIGIHDFGSLPAGEEPGLWIAMDWWDGGAGNEVTADRFEDAARWAGQLLAALAHAHAHGVVHRDVKPANLLFSGDLRHLVLADFGLASAPRTAGGPLRSGTPTFMAPEQALGQRQGPWTDLYAVGGVLWAWLCGRPPFWFDDPKEAMQAQIHAPVPAFRPRVEVPAGLEAWLVRCLAKDPFDRFPSAAAARSALGRLVRSPEGSPLPKLGAVAYPRSAARTDVGVRALWPLRLPPLVGREAAWEALRDAWRATATEGGVRAFAVRGPPGSGRATLGDRFLTALREAGVTALALGDPAKAPVGPALDELVGLMDPARRARWAEAHGRPDLLDELSAFAEDPSRVGSPLGLLAEVLAVGGAPVAVFTTQPGPVVDALAGAGADALVLWLAPEDAPGPGLTLGPLTEDAVVELVARALGESADRAREAWTSTGGDPAALADWLTHRRGLGFAGRLPDAAGLSADAVTWGLALGWLPQPVDLDAARPLAEVLGVADVEGALLELASAGALRARWRHGVVDLPWHDALVGRAGADAGRVRGAVGDALLAVERTALEGLALVAASDRPARAVPIAASLLARDVPVESLIDPLTPLGDDDELLLLIRAAGALPARVSVADHRTRTRALLAAWDGAPRDGWWLATAIRVESVSHNAYRSPGLAEEVAAMITASDRARPTPTGWGELARSIGPWRASDLGALEPLDRAIAEADANHQVRPGWAARVQRGQLLASVGRHAEAAEDHRQALALRDDPATRVLRALSLDALGAPAAEIDGELATAWAAGWRLRPRLRTWLQGVRVGRLLHHHDGSTRDPALEHELRAAERAAGVHAQPAQAAQAALMQAVYAGLHGDLGHLEAAWTRFCARLPEDWSEAALVGLLDRLAATGHEPEASQAAVRAAAMRARLGG